MLIGIVVVESILFEISDIPVFMGNLFDPTIRYASIYIDINNQIVLLIGVARLSGGQTKFFLPKSLDFFSLRSIDFIDNMIYSFCPRNYG